jgi:pSer/pThr/pTyr-binding forkhead associated (FHA) protein
LPFQLRVARGHSEGRSYLCAQSSVRVGAAEGCDVVLSDAGVSATHLQIVERGGRYFVTDLASANGTWVNGEPVQAERELKTGDAVALGSALLSFVLVDEKHKATPKVPVETRDDTRPEPLKRQELPTDLKGQPSDVISTDRVKPRIFKDDDATAPVAEPLGRRAPIIEQETTAPEALPLGALGDRQVPRPQLPLGELSNPSINSLLYDHAGVQREEPSHGSLPPLEISRSELLALRGDDSQPSGRSLSVTPVNDPGESTADERPHRHHHTDALVPRTNARPLRLMLEDLPGWAKTGGAAVLGLFVVLLGAVLFRLARGPVEPALPPEPDELSQEPINFSFGLGPGVDFEQPDQRTFTFLVPLSPPTLALIHYEAQDVDGKEVAILVNNADLGFVPADGVAGRQVELVVGPETLQGGQKNAITFDNLRNPPGRESWRVSRLAVTLQRLSPLEPAAAIADAGRRVEAGNGLYKDQRLAPDNLFKAYVAYRGAWLTLVGNDSGAAKALLKVAKAKADEVGLQLDKECARLIAAAKQQMDEKNPQQARVSLNQIEAEFSSDEHRCRALAAERREEYLLK